MSNKHPSQERFDQQYITSTEICKTLLIARSMLLHARLQKKIPEPIVVNDGQIMLWERKDAQPFIDAHLAKRSRVPTI